MARFEERKESMNQIRKLLLERDRTWKELLNEIKRSPATLSKILDELMKSGEVSAYTDSKDRRITFYSLNNKERTNGEVERFRTIEFLINLKNPEFQERPFEQTKGKIKFHGRAAIVLEEPKFPKGVHEIIGQLDLKPFENAFNFTDKVAVIITLERSKTS